MGPLCFGRPPVPHPPLKNLGENLSGEHFFAGGIMAPLWEISQELPHITSTALFLFSVYE